MTSILGTSCYNTKLVYMCIVKNFVIFRVKGLWNVKVIHVFKLFHNKNLNIALKTTTISHSILHTRTKNAQQVCNYEV